MEISYTSDMHPATLISALLLVALVLIGAPFLWKRRNDPGLGVCPQCGKGLGTNCEQCEHCRKERNWLQGTGM